MRTRFLPYSGRRISVSICGVIFLSGKKLEPNKGKVKLAWALGLTDYDVRFLHYIAWSGSVVEDHLFTRMQMVSEAEYYFDELECDSKPEHYHVPGYSNYVITRDGKLFSLKSNRYMTWGVVKDAGYRYCRAVTDNGESRVLFRHRALCLTFKHPKTTVRDLVVNHLNGIPGSDALENIIWATYSENNQHAYDNDLKSNSQLAIESLDLVTGEKNRYPSIAACSKACGVGRDTIRWRISKGNFEVYNDKLLFKVADGSSFPPVDQTKVNRLGRGCDFIARNVFTKEQIVFTGATHGESLTGVKKDTILLHARTKADLPIHGYNFRYLDDVATFKDHSPRSLDIFKDNPVKPSFGVVVTDVDTGDEIFYTSIRLTMDSYGLSKGYILDLCKSDKPRDNKIFALHDPRLQ